MQIIAKRTLKLFWHKHPQAEEPLRHWFALVAAVRWNGPSDVKAMFGTAVDFVSDKG